MLWGETSKAPGTIEQVVDLMEEARRGSLGKSPFKEDGLKVELGGEGVAGWMCTPV